MQTKEIIGTTVTNIYTLVKMEVGGLDTAECFVELDNKTIIDIPFGFSEDIWIKELDKDAVSLFDEMPNYPVYHVNKDKKTILCRIQNEFTATDVLWSLDDFHRHDDE